jgi:hypothetical protein
MWLLTPECFGLNSSPESVALDILLLFAYTVFMFPAAESRYVATTLLSGAKGVQKTSPP